MSLTKRYLETVETENQTRILKAWYEALDRDYGEHEDPDDRCDICYEAMQLGIIEDYYPELEE